MNKSCHNCEKEISYYAGFCHYCDTFQGERNEPIYEENNIGKRHDSYDGFFGAPITVERLPNGIEITRIYTTDEITEDWIDLEGVGWFQRWKKIDKGIFRNWGKKKSLQYIYIDCLPNLPNEPKVTNVNTEFTKEFFQTRRMIKCDHSELEELNDDGTQKYRIDYDFYYNYFLESSFISRKDIERGELFSEQYGYYADSRQIRYIIKEENRKTLSYDKPKFIEASYFHPDGRENKMGNSMNEYLVFEYDKWGEALERPDIILCVGVDKTRTYPVLYEFSSSRNDVNADEYEKLLKVFQNEKKSYFKQKKLSKYHEELFDLKNNFDASKYDKQCTECFETIKLPAKICHFCKKAFTSHEIESAIDMKFREIYPEP